jgi:hypothetical protein
MGASQQNFTISGVFKYAIGYLIMRLTLAGGLQGVYIGGGNDPYVVSLWPKPPGNGPCFAFVVSLLIEFGLTYNITFPGPL